MQNRNEANDANLEFPEEIWSLDEDSEDAEGMEDMETRADDLHA